MAAILTQAVVKTNTTNIFWIESPKFSKVGQQNQCGCKKSQTMVQYVFSMAAILKFKMAAGIVVENIGTKVFLDSAPQIHQSWSEKSMWVQKITNYGPSWVFHGGHLEIKNGG